MHEPLSKLLRPAALPCFEEILERYYAQMQDWAIGLTRGDLEKAEDIVHDLCLHLALTRPDLSRVENFEGYLYTCLRHCYQSHLNRSSREALQSLTMAEFDSIQVAFWAQPEGDPLRIQNELRRICSYAIWRKAQTKTASYFILRFFHSYSLQEIADRACVPLVTIYDKLSKARSELQIHLNEPRKIKLAVRDIPPAPDLRWSPVPSTEIFQELRRLILNARTGTCPSEEALLAPYLTLNPKPLSCASLSHLVSCERCLALVDAHFRRSNFDGGQTSVRFQSSASGKDDGHSVSARGRQAVLQAIREHTQDLCDHRPRRLSIAVDGKIVASHTVIAMRSDLSARIERPENASFVEVFSDQGLRLGLLALGPQPPAGAQKRVQRVELSDERWLELTLTFDGMGLESEVAYFDPSLTSDAFAAQEEKNAPPDMSEIDADRPASGVDSASPEFPIDSRDIHRQAGQWKPFYRFATLWSSLRFRSKQMAPADTNLLLASACVLGLASIVCFFAWIQSRPKVSADALLTHAEKWGTGEGSAQPGIIYQKVRIKTPQRILDRTIYRDAQGRRKPRRQQLGVEDEQLQRKLATAGVNWDEPLSAATYKDWHDHQPVERDAIARTGRNLLTLTTTSAPGSQVLQETLTVRESDFHPVGRTVELRDAGMVEIAELNYDVMPWGAASDGWFEPLAGSARALVPGHLKPSVHLPAAVAESVLDEAELAARLTLNKLHADTGERIDIARTASGIQVKGIVETDARKHELEAQLERLPHVIPSIFSYRDMEDHTSGALEINTVRASSVTTQPTPLEQYLAPKGWTEDQIGNLSYQMGKCSLEVERESKAIAALTRFPGEAQLTPAAQATLRELVAQHRQALLAALQQEEREIARTGIDPSFAGELSANAAAPSIVEEAKKHLVLSKELTFSSSLQSRSVEEIVPELAASISQLREAAAHLPADLRAMPISSRASSQSHLAPNEER